MTNSFFDLEKKIKKKHFLFERERKKEDNSDSNHISVYILQKVDIYYNNLFD